MTQGAKPCVIFRYKVKRLVGREFGFLNISSKPVIHINYKSLYSKVRFDWQQRQEVDTEKRAQLMYALSAMTYVVVKSIGLLTEQI